MQLLFFPASLSSDQLKYMNTCNHRGKKPTTIYMLKIKQL